MHVHDILLVILRLNKTKSLTYSINFTIERERNGNTYSYLMPLKISLSLSKKKERRNVKIVHRIIKYKSQILTELQFEDGCSFLIFQVDIE
jgi:urease gamma subunit